MTKQEILDTITLEMHAYEEGCPKRIHHFTKVHSFAATIGRLEKLSPEEQFTLELAATLHDIGIKPSKEKYGYCDGKTQEEVAPPIAREMLQGKEVSEEMIDRICYLIAHHHTYKNVDGLDYRILLEADALVNMYEDEMTEKQLISFYNLAFRTEAGSKLCRTMFHLDPILGESK